VFHYKVTALPVSSKNISSKLFLCSSILNTSIFEWTSIPFILAPTKEEIIQAAKVANVHHFITTLPDGYNMFLNEEASNISLGEK
ncbi:hypothetical protein ACTPEM_24670, partial [Clostridioides difficile]